MKKLILILIISLTLVAIYFLLVNKNDSTNQVNLSTTSPNPTSLPTATLTKFKVPILMYHYIRDYHDTNDQIGIDLSVSPEKFAEQLNWLKNNGYQTVSPNYLTKPYAISYKPVILTFDDGYRDAYTDAYPILKSFEFTATFYLITDYIEKNNPQYLSWDMAREMIQNNMNIGSHTLSHPDLAKSTADRANLEIVESKKLIAEKTGVTISDFCYPSGKYNQEIIEMVKNAGYKTAVTVKQGIADQDSNFFELSRIRMKNNTNLEKILK